MNSLVVAQLYPKLQLGYSDAYLTKIIIDGYVERVEFEDVVLSDYNYRNYNWFIPSLEDYVEDNEQIDELIDDLTAMEIYGEEIHFAMEGVKDEDMEEFMDGFYGECRKNSVIFRMDVLRVVDFYKLSFCMNPKEQRYTNFPLRKVW